MINKRSIITNDKIYKIRDFLRSDPYNEMMRDATSLFASRGPKWIPSILFSLSLFSTFFLNLIAKFDVKKTQMSYSMTVESADYFYRLSQIWLTDKIAIDTQNNFEAFLGGDFYDVSSENVTDVKFVSSDSVVRSFTYNNVKVSVSVESEGQPKGINTPNPYLEKKIKFTVIDPYGRDILKKIAEEIASLFEPESSKPKVFTATSYGQWRSDNNQIYRSLESVILGGDLIYDIRDDINSFLSQEDKYVNLGIPYHRGYLLYGPPGSGKSSAVKALGQNLGLNVYYISLTSFKSDSDITTIFSQVKPNSIILMEDIDAASLNIHRDEQNTETKLTLSGLLNALDGITSPHGLIVFMTTNSVDKLDKALIRAGRLDRKYLIDHADPDQTCKMISYFTGVDLDPDKVAPRLSPVNIVEYVKHTFDMNPEEIEPYIKESIYSMESEDYYLQRH